MKQVWVIKKTGDFHENKESLKKVRKELHKKIGIDEDSPEFKAKSDGEKAASMVYTISRGPDHPRL